MDADSPDSLAHSAEDDIHTSAASIEDADLHHVARWHDVHAAAAAVLEVERRQWLVEVSGQLANGDSQETIASGMGTSQATVSRRSKAGVDEILAELNRPPAQIASAA